MKIEVAKHVLVPKHVKLNEKEKKQLFEKYNITLKEIPKISIADAGIQSLKPTTGDIIKVIRKSRTCEESVYYRGIIDE
ncbi:DNA-directed RNA polymerase subunit H [Candidatus Woesearchaeota archaeon]|nr:DNA-directed RNA polymerase subunit H [Candidatus Woesearchaeota archaeon]